MGTRQHKHEVETHVSYLTDRAGLEGKVAVITGGAGGLGWPISRDLARAGVHVAVCDRDEAALAAVEAELKALPVTSLLTHADVREPEAMAAFFEEIDQTFGRVDVLIDVPGGGFVTPLMNTNAKGWQAIIKQNFLYVLDTTQHAVKRMKAQGTGGSIIYITSVEAHRAVPNRAVYGAMKAGVTNLAMTLALELGPDNIRINTVAPDIFPTPNSGGYDPEYQASFKGQISAATGIPMARVGTGEDLSGCLLFLASDLSSYVTGTTLHVDGGTLASSGWFNWPTEGYANMLPPHVVDYLADIADSTGGG
ncbi:MAG: short-chain dehydrogenase/reductase [Acidimicrobiia bacterium]|nr:short-chain dehydrogenase/reductase [Acidimicrobiia bacterium]